MQGSRYTMPTARGITIRTTDPNHPLDGPYPPPERRFLACMGNLILPGKHALDWRYSLFLGCTLPLFLGLHPATTPATLFIAPQNPRCMTKDRLPNIGETPRRGELLLSCREKSLAFVFGKETTPHIHKKFPIKYFFTHSDFLY